MKLLFAFSIILVVQITHTIRAQASWSPSDQAAYSANKSDSSTWDMKMLEEDISSHLSHNWPTEHALSNYPSPVPEYDWGYGFLAKNEIEIDGKLIEGVSVGFAKDKYRDHLLSDTSDYYINYFNIFIWTDIEEIEAGANTIVSRNYPHYLSTGKQKTTMGSVDWVQMCFAGGENFALINQRYFDLNFGKTLLVIPLKDGSLRMLQIDEEIGSISSAEVMGKLEQGEFDPKEAYLNRLSTNPKVHSFLSNKNLLSRSN